MGWDDASGSGAEGPLGEGASGWVPPEPPEWLRLEWELNDLARPQGVAAGALGPVLSAAFRGAPDKDLAAAAVGGAGRSVGTDPDADSSDGAQHLSDSGQRLWDIVDGVDSGLFASPEELEVFPASVVRAELREMAAAGLVRRLVRLEQLEADRLAEQAAVLGALVDLCAGDGTDPLRTAEAASIAASEVSAALKVSARTARGLVVEALSLSDPAAAPVLAALAAGRLSRRRAKTVLDAAVPVPPARLAAFLTAAVEAACPADPDRIPSPAALTRRLRRLVEDHADEPFTTRKAHAAAGRRVDLDPAPDGMCWLTAYLPLEHGAAIDTRLEAIARSLHAPGEARTLPQLRADALADLLTTDLLTAGAAPPGAPDPAALSGAAALSQPAALSRAGVPDAPAAPGLAPRAEYGVPAGSVGPARSGVRCEVLLVLPAATAAGTADTPAELLGYGPLDPAAARLLAADAATWTRLWADPATGAPLAIGRTRYAPTAAMRRYLGARDAACRFPGCDRPAATTEADHTIEWHAGGHTAAANLALLCREHHRLKTRGHWTLTQTDTTQTGTIPHGAPAPAPAPAPPQPVEPPGTLRWTSPAGLAYTTYPHHDPPPPF
ncbi:HNH endonuclease signature motif containing protein [Sinomonas soli]